jgi:hypothetical protein
MASGFKCMCGVLIASSLFVSSTGAVAAANSTPVSAPVSATQINPWIALSAMSGGASAAALCGAAAVAAAAQTPGGCVLPVLDAAPPVAQTAPPPQPIPVPPVEGPSGLGLGVDPLLLALGVLAAGALVYFLVVRHHHNNSNSPA